MRKVKWGVLSTADIARRETIPGMQKAGNCELYAIAGRSLEKANQFASKVYEEAAKANQNTDSKEEDIEDKKDDNVVDADYEEN